MHSLSNTVDMNTPKYYRHPWDKEKVELLIEWWPHFGTYGMERIFDEIKRKQIKSKVNKLRLKLLPKNQRLCITCKNGFQFARSGGLKCRECHLSNRRDCRRSKMYSFDDWMQEMARECRYRSKKRHNTESDIDSKYLIKLWNDQDGICFYSGTKMILPKFRRGRACDSASIDRMDSSKAYLKSNIAWCCWGCNAGKSNFSTTEYINLCKAVAKNNHDK